MRASELRIGNLVMFAGNSGIEYRKIKCIKLNEFGFLSDYDGVNFEICKPIPLTEEWLLRFGFEKSDKLRDAFKKQYYYNFTKNIDNKFIETISFELTEYNNLYPYFFEHIQHVHELQNLYFALTNEELTLKNK
jgi:hypothetical protein